jgi:hypothetical protein
LIKSPLSQRKSVLKRGVDTLEGDIYVVIYYLLTSQIWPDIGVIIGGSGLIRGMAFGGKTVI